jgi:hypothetical protein
MDEKIIRMRVPLDYPVKIGDELVFAITDEILHLRIEEYCKVTTIETRHAPHLPATQNPAREAQRAENVKIITLCLTNKKTIPDMKGVY